MGRPRAEAGAAAAAGRLGKGGGDGVEAAFMQVLWGSGNVAPQEAKAERWAIVLRCFEVLEKIDAVAAGYTAEGNTTVLRLRRRGRRRRGLCE